LPPATFPYLLKSHPPTPTTPISSTIHPSLPPSPPSFLSSNP